MAMMRLRPNAYTEIFREKIGIRKELIDIEVRRAIKGLWLIDDMMIPNRLLWNYYEMIGGLLRDVNANCKDNTGASRTIRTSGAVPYNPCYLYQGEDTEELPFDAYTLTSATYVTRDAVEALAHTNYSECKVSATASKDGSSLGILGRFSDTGGTQRLILLNGVLFDYTSGSPIYCSLKFYEPWVYNIANIWRAWLDKVDAEGEKDMAGVTYKVRGGSGETVALGVKIALGEGTGAWSPTDYTMTNPFTLSPTYQEWSSEDGYELLIRAWYIPDTDKSIPEIGLVGKLYDDAGGTHDTLLARIALETTPLNLTANTLYVIRIRIMGT